MRRFLIKSFVLISPLFFFLLISSCSSVKKIKYYQDLPDSGQLKTIPKAEYIEPKIQVDDILTVILQTVDPQASAIINSNNFTGGTTSPFSAGNPVGYLVNKDGEIDIPIIGKIKVIGLTTTEATDVISKAAGNFYKEHSVIVRFANFKISIVGEVARPGTYTMPNEKISVLDAIALAGDLTIFGVRDNVLLIRENPDGSKTPYRINLQKTDFMSSPYFYLRQNDYIYVQPDKSKAALTDASRTKIYAIVGAFLSVLIVFVAKVKF